jgi:hypothetical protein
MTFMERLYHALFELAQTPEAEESEIQKLVKFFSEGAVKSAKNRIDEIEEAVRQQEQKKTSITI